MSDRRLDDWLTGYLRYVEKTEPVPLFKIWAGISAIAACLQRKCFTCWDKRIFPNQYIVLIGPSSCGKNTAMSPVTEMLTDIGIPLAPNSVTREKLIRNLRKSTTNIIDPISEKPILHSSLTIISDELSVFLGVHELKFLNDLTDWYDCGRGRSGTWTYETATQGEHEILGIWVNILGGMTPDSLQESLPKGAIGGGFTSRIMFVYSPGREIQPVPFMFLADHSLYEDLVFDLTQINAMVGQFTFDESFVDMMTDWYVAQRKNPPQLGKEFEGYIGRRPTHMMKLCMALSASRGSSMQITTEDFQRALLLLEETERVMPNVYSAYGANELAPILNRVAAYIGSHKMVLFSELLRMFMRDVDKEGLMKILMTLESTRFCTMKGENIATGEDGKTVRDIVVRYQGRN